ncbi:MAG: hypothetical protein ACLT0Y_09195 [Christensenellales bacterium]
MWRTMAVIRKVDSKHPIGYAPEATRNLIEPAALAYRISSSFTGWPRCWKEEHGYHH